MEWKEEGHTVGGNVNFLLHTLGHRGIKKEYN
jgi:muramoyltetrapeptide carboxypeptidase LdcA involved in peptidoglycan recycling